MAAKGYDDAGRQKRAAGYLEHLFRHFDLRGKRVLEIGPYMGDLSIALTSEFDCEVVGIDPLEHPIWGEVQRQHPRIRMVHGDIANPPDDLGDEVILEFDRKRPKQPIPDPVYRLDRGS